MFQRLAVPASRNGFWRFACAALLTYGGVAWLGWLHDRAGIHESSEPPFVLHVLRDATFALPAVLVAVMAAAWLSRRVQLMTAGSRLTPTLEAAILAAAAAVALGAGSPVHESLFGGHHDVLGGVHQHHEALGGVPEHGSVLVHVGFDMLLALPAELGLALMALMLPGAVLVARRSYRHRKVAIVLASALAVFGALIGSPVLAQGGGTPPPPSTDPGNPCPGDAPVKSFEITALNVDIPLNRFGDHDPAGKMYTLTENISAVRNEEQTQHVSIGLRDDPIQPLVIRANLGDCVGITYHNRATGGSYGVHLDGLEFAMGSSGDAIGKNADSGVAPGTDKSYWFWVPRDPNLEGAHYMSAGPGYRSAVGHGLFGTLAVEPAGSTYLSPADGRPMDAPTGVQHSSGWEMTIAPPTRDSFREGVKILHEVGNDNELIFNKNGVALPQVDDITGSYRPGEFALNYRSEPFRDRLLNFPKEKSHSYGSYTFGDPSTPMPRGYLGDPTKFRIVHGGGEKFHVYHLHGGGDRWRLNPVADTTYDYGDTGLNKTPSTRFSPSNRLDSQSMGPGESYNLEIEGGAGGVQQSVGDFLFHCHIAKHYVSGMWSFWRVYNTLQSDFAPLPDRAPPAAAVDSAGLLGPEAFGNRPLPDGSTLTPANLDDWIRPQLPPQGRTRSNQDATVWDWTVDNNVDSRGPIYLGEPEDLTLWPDSPNYDDRSKPPNRLPGDQMVADRPRIMFDPISGRPAYPLLRPHIGKRPPFAPNEHSGAPYLGENVDAPKSGSGPDPYANRNDGLCATGTGVKRNFNIVAIETPVQVTAKGVVDPEGKIFVLAQDKAAVLSGAKKPEPLAIRSNIGDCDAVTLTNQMTDKNAFDGYSKVTIHIHHVQFDVQGSDGVTTGFAYEHSVRPFAVEDPKLAAAAAAGSQTLSLTNAGKFQPGVAIGVGLGTNGLEIRTVTAINGNTVTLDQPLDNAHPTGEPAGTEFIQYRWYPDVALDNIFFHDHVDGIHGWGHGLVGQLIIEPKGSTYHDPRTGAQVDSGTIVDIHSPRVSVSSPSEAEQAWGPLAAGSVNGSYREMALWTIDDNSRDDFSSLNLRREPFADRPSAPNRFSSYKYGDPYTPLPRAYQGDPIVIRTINISPTIDTLHFQGSRFSLEPRYVDGALKPEGNLLDTIHYGISEKYTLILNGEGQGSASARPGDYLYFNGIDRRLSGGAWGLIRVMAGKPATTSPNYVKPLPDNPVPTLASPLPTKTGGNPPALSSAGNPCPTGAPARSFAISAVDLPLGNGLAKAAYVPTSLVPQVKAGTIKPEPLVLHASAGECVTVNFTNDRTPLPLQPTLPMAGFAVSKLDRTPESSGVNVGFTPQQYLTPGNSRTYVYYADTDKIGTASIADFSTTGSAKKGLYGALVVAPTGAQFSDPVTGAAEDVGSQVDVQVSGGQPYRDFTVLMADNDARMGQDFMPYPTNTEKGVSGINYRFAPIGDGPNSFSWYTTGNIPTPVLRAYAGDPVQVHAMVAPGSEQAHVFSLGGLSWMQDSNLHNSNAVTAQGFGPWESIEAHVTGGAGGQTNQTGDFFYGDLRRPFTQVGLWGWLRSLPTTPGSSCTTILPLAGRGCG